MKRLSQLRNTLRNEDGGVNMHMLLILFLLTFTFPYFWDVASVHYTRRMAQVGADNAVLGAAQEYASKLQHTPEKNGIFLGMCEKFEFRPELVLLRYVLDPTFDAPIDLGNPLAFDFADKNLNKLLSFDAWVDFDNARDLFGIPIPVLRASVRTERKVNTAYGSLYRRDFHVPNEAQAVIYLNAFNVTPRYCGYGSWTFDFSFKWKIALDSPDGDNSISCAAPGSVSIDSLWTEPEKKEKKTPKMPKSISDIVSACGNQ